jgi:hypothetical protein
MSYNAILSSNEIADILNNPIVKTNQEKLSTEAKVDFSIQFDANIKTKLESILAIDLSQTETIPLRWIKGDTPSHTDKAEKHFNNTYLIYLTNSIGNLIIDGQSYAINAGDAHIFNEGLEHSTINTGNSERLMIGPMSETGFRVGAASIYYYNNETDASNSENYISTSGYTLETVGSISEWVILRNVSGTNPSPNGGPYATGTNLINTGAYFVYPYIPPPPPTQRFSMSSLFSNNAQVYYKPHSLSAGSIGSGVRNSRHIKRNT